MIKEILILQKYKLPIKQVVANSNNEQKLNEAYTGSGRLINSDFLNGLTVEEAKELIIEKIENLNIEKVKFYIV